MKKINFLALIVIIDLLFIIPQISIVADDILEAGGIKCGTLLPQEKIKKQYDRIQFKDSLVFQAKHISESGKFLIHYDTIGNDAVSLKDLNKNGIPDYIDSASYFFDMVYKLYVDTIGYISPIREKITKDEDRYQVYIMDLGNGEVTYYGVTFNKEEVYPRKKFIRYYSYITIDNNYSPNDSTINVDKTKKKTYYETGISALKITIAHEFHHSIQFFYGLDPLAQTLMEITSTFMEWRVCPDTYDYMQFVRNLYKQINLYPFGVNSADVGYRYAIFGQYIYKKYGDIILKRMWEMIGDNIPGYTALDSAFREQGSDLTNEWRGFIPWIYYTGRRAIENEYFDKATEFPELTFYRDEKFKIPSFLETNELRPFEICCYRCHLPSDLASTDDTVDVIISNIDLKSAGRLGDTKHSFNFYIVNLNQQDAKQLGNTNYYYKFTDNNYVFDSVYFSNGIPTKTLSYCYPNPLILSEGNEIFFSAPENAKLDVKDVVDLVVYNSEMTEVYSKKSNIEVDVIKSNGNKVVKWSSIPSDISSGIYIYRIIFKDNESIGKFVIINK